jgi:shikimate kinase
VRIFLIGLPGSGKSFLGKQIAAVVNLPFIDLDDVIAQREGMPVSEIFSAKGEPYFRSVEADTLREQCERDEFAMATGGGTPCFFDNMEVMNASGTSVFLNTPMTSIVQRLQADQKELRPLLAQTSDEQLEQKLNQLFEQRLPFYRQAHLTVTTEITAGELVKLIYPETK